MKLILLSVFFIAANLLNVSDQAVPPIECRFTPTAIVHQLFEMLRGLLRNGDAAKKIPVLDPYTIDEARLKFDKEFYRVHMNVSGFTFSGLGNFQIDEQEFIKEDVALKVKISLPLLKLEAEYYEMQGDIKEAIPLTGQGVLHFEVKNVILYSKIYLRQSSNGKSILVDKLEDTNFTIEKILSRTELDGKFDDIFNAWVGDLLADYLTRFSKKLVVTYNDLFLVYFNSIINEYETWSILVTIL